MDASMMHSRVDVTNGVSSPRAIHQHSAFRDAAAAASRRCGSPYSDTSMRAALGLLDPSGSEAVLENLSSRLAPSGVLRVDRQTRLDRQEGALAVFDNRQTACAAARTIETPYSANLME
jgi:hypothetical protein